MATALRRFIPVVIRATPQRRQCVQPPAVLTETGLAPGGSARRRAAAGTASFIDSDDMGTPEVLEQPCPSASRFF